MMQACDGSYVWEGGRTRENRYLRRESRLKGEKRCERHDTPISLQIQRSHPYKHSTAPTFMSPHSHLFLMLSFFIPNFPAPSFISLFLTSADSQHSHFSAYDVLGTTKLCLKKNWRSRDPCSTLLPPPLPSKQEASEVLPPISFFDLQVWIVHIHKPD